MQRTTEPATWPAGDGEMARRIREHDWAATPLGPIEAWPQSLRTAVALMVESRQPAYVAWGPESISLYNDGYIPIAGPKHPYALGQPYRVMWAEIWDEYRSLVAATMAGEAYLFRDRPVPLVGRPGRPTSWFTFSWTPLRDETGAVAGFYCTAIETTDEVLARERLRVSEERQAFLLRLSDALRPLADPAAIQGEACRLLGEHLDAHRAYYVEVYEAQDVAVVEQDYARGLPSLVGDIPLAAFRWVLPLYKLGRPVVVPDLATSPLVPESDRAAMAAAQIISWIAIPLVKGGELVGALCVADAEPRTWTDAEVALAEATAERIWSAVERARAEKALRASEARLQLALDVAEVGTWAWDLATGAGEIDARGAAIVGLPPGPLLDIAAAQRAATHPDDLDALLAAVAAGIASDADFDLAYRVVHPDGGVHHVASRARAFMDAAGRPARLVGTNRDVTAEREGEAAREAFVDAAAHDLRSPLTALKGHTQLLQRRARRAATVDAAALASGLAAIDAATGRMVALIDDMMDAAHLRSGRPLDLKVTPTDLVALAATAADEARQSTTRHVVRVVADVPALRGTWDGARLARVFGNLLSNAVKYSPAAGEIVVRVGREDDAAGTWAVLAVRDQGVGISAADVPRLFERFRRGANVAGIRGSGLGLAGAKQIVEQHGGTIAVASEEGAGTTVTVRLPMTPPAGARARG